VASPSGTSGNHLNAVATGPDGTVWTAGMSFNTSGVIPRQQLGAAGFTLNNLVRTVIDPTCTSIGRVMSQNPGAGVVEPIGTVVSVTVGAQDRRHPCQ